MSVGASWFAELLERDEAGRQEGLKEHQEKEASRKREERRLGVTMQPYRVIIEARHGVNRETVETVAAEELGNNVVIYDFEAEKSGPYYRAGIDSHHMCETNEPILIVFLWYYRKT